MRTKLSNIQLFNLIRTYFGERGSEVNFLHLGQNEEGEIVCIVDHDSNINLPSNEEW